MTYTTPPPYTGCLPCQLDPEGWFDDLGSADAIADCRTCPATRWCAREALHCGASWGVWAGIWIDGRHEEAVPDLEAIATHGLTQRSPSYAALLEVRPAPLPVPLHRPNRSSRPKEVTTAVLARSSGHCEVFAEGCRYSYERLVSRLMGQQNAESCTPPDLFAACSSCADMVAALDPKLAVQFGYVADTQRSLVHVPFYWRQSRWVLLDRDGWLTEIADDAQTA